MHITFLGTRGGIKRTSRLHTKHSSLLISYKKTRIIIDWGLDWLTTSLPHCNALLITHDHPDHAGGLSKKIKTPILAVGQAYSKLFKKFPDFAQELLPRNIYKIGDLTIEPFLVMHSLRAPAVGYRIASETHTLWYAPDLVHIIDEENALSACDLYIGDGAIITRTLLKRIKNHTPTGHAPIIEQIEWCARYQIPQAYFSHCGTEIVSLSKQEHTQAERLLSSLHEIPSVHIATDRTTIVLHESI